MTSTLWPSMPPCEFSHEAHAWIVGEVWAIDEASGPVQLQMSPSTMGWFVLAPAVAVVVPMTSSEALSKSPAASAVRTGTPSRLNAACAIASLPFPRNHPVAQLCPGSCGWDHTNPGCAMCCTCCMCRTWSPPGEDRRHAARTPVIRESCDVHHAHRGVNREVPKLDVLIATAVRDQRVTPSAPEQAVAFPVLTDEQISVVEAFGSRRAIRTGDLVPAGRHELQLLRRPLGRDRRSGRHGWGRGTHHPIRPGPVPRPSPTQRRRGDHPCDRLAVLHWSVASACAGRPSAAGGDRVRPLSLHGTDHRAVFRNGADHVGESDG